MTTTKRPNTLLTDITLILSKFLHLHAEQTSDQIISLLNKKVIFSTMVGIFEGCVLMLRIIKKMIRLMGRGRCSEIEHPTCRRSQSQFLVFPIEGSGKKLCERPLLKPLKSHCQSEYTILTLMNQRSDSV